ncbi:MAG: ribbon-helix-helix domain-containing protein [Thermoprotei archaeon]
MIYMPRTTFYFNKRAWERLQRVSAALKISNTKTIEQALELLEKKLIDEGVLKPETAEKTT